MRFEALLLVSMILVAGCISEASICTEGEERCVGEERQACEENQWARVGTCEIPLTASEIMEAQSDYATGEFDVRGTITSKEDSHIQIDDAVWVECTSAECLNSELGQEVTVKSTPQLTKTYNITYTLPRTQSYLAERYELPHTSFPVSDEGAITSDDCNSMSESYFVENAVSPSDSTQYSLSYVGFYAGDASVASYNQVMTNLCAVEDASIVSSYSNDSTYMWCAKIRAEDYCYFSSSNFLKGDWDWELPSNIGLDESGMPAYRDIEVPCNSYGGKMVQQMEKHHLRGIYAFKAPTCRVKIFAPGELVNTTADCTALGGKVTDGECMIIDADAKNECGNNNDAPDGTTCYLRSACYALDGSFEFKDGDYYCTDSKGITKNGIFASYDEGCLYGGVTICNLKSYQIEEEIITDYSLKEV